VFVHLISTSLIHPLQGDLQGLQVLNNKGALSGIKYYKIGLCKFCIMGRQRTIAFSTSQCKTKGLLDSYTQLCGDLHQQHPFWVQGTILRS